MLQKYKKRRNEKPHEKSPQPKKSSVLEDIFNEFDELTPSDYIAKQTKLRNSKQYKDIHTQYKEKMNKLIKAKTKQDLYNECAMEQCDFNQCQCIERISIVLYLYDKVLKCDKLWKRVPMGPLVSISDKYAHQQLHNDFLHIKLYHIDADNQKKLKPNNDNNTSEEKKDDSKYQNVAKKLCQRYSKDYKCEDVSKCPGFKRHYRDRMDKEVEKDMFHQIQDSKSQKTVETRNDKELILQEELDKIHSYFLQFRIYFYVMMIPRCCFYVIHNP